MIPTEFKLKAWHVTNGFIAPNGMEVTNVQGIWELRRDNRWWPFLVGDIIIQTPNGQFYSLPYNETLTMSLGDFGTYTDSDRIDELEKQIEELQTRFKLQQRIKELEYRVSELEEYFKPEISASVELPIIKERIKELERQLMNVIKDNGKQNESSNFPRL